MQIARRLYAAGCRHAFGIPGGEVLALIDGLRAAGLRFVLTKHENAAGFMAEGVHHRDGAPGVLVATLGPGVANAVNVVANAWQDRVPLIFLTGRVDAAEAETYTHQVFDHAALLRPITKASLTAVDGAVDVVIDKALAICLGVAEGVAHTATPIGRPRPAPAVPAPGPKLAAARALFANAERPLLLVGVDVLNQHGEADVAAFARAYGVPVITTYKAKGVLPEDEPLALGGAGLSPKADDILLPLVRSSDCLLLAGYDPIEMRIGWRHPWPADAPVISFTAAPETHYMHAVSHAFVGNVAAGLAALSANLGPGRRRWPQGEPAAVRLALKAAFGPTPGMADGRPPGRGQPNWGPATAFHTIRRVLPRHAVVTADSGAHRILLSQAWEAYQPRTLLQSSALCTMGCAVPLAIGAKLATPDTPVVAFVGDAGMEMVLGELATLRDLALPVVIVVLVDSSLALIELKQRRSKLPNVGVDFGATDFAAVAEAMGGHGVVVGDAPHVAPAQLATSMVDALDRDRFTLIACQIGRRPYDGTF